MGDEPLKDQGRPFRSVVCFMVTFHCTPSLITSITWTYCMHQVQGAIALRSLHITASAINPAVQPKHETASLRATRISFV